MTQPQKNAAAAVPESPSSKPLKRARRDRRRRIALIVATAFFLLMIGIGSIPYQASQLSAFLPDKVLHMMAYAFLAGLLVAGQRPDSRWRGAKAMIAIGILGAMDEAVQSLFPYRTANLGDWLFDMLAASLVVAAWKIGRRKRRPVLELSKVPSR